MVTLRQSTRTIVAELPAALEHPTASSGHGRIYRNQHVTSQIIDVLDAPEIKEAFSFRLITLVSGLHRS